MLPSVLLALVLGPIVSSSPNLTPFKVQAEAAATSAAEAASAVQAAAVPGSATLITPATGTVARTLGESSGDVLSVLNFIPRAEHAAIRAGTSTTDVYSYIMDAINATTINRSATLVATPVIFFPPGKYTVGSTIELKKTVTLRGSGSGQAGGDPVILQFPADTTGIIVARHNTCGAQWNACASTTGGDGSTIEGLTLVGAGKAVGTSGHGIWLRARAILRNLVIRSFRGDGVHIAAASDAAEAELGNANNWQAENVRVNNNGGHGFYTKGADANAGLALHLNLETNGVWGLYEASFLGNTYVAPHTSANGTYYSPWVANQAMTLSSPYRTTTANRQYKIQANCTTGSTEPTGTGTGIADGTCLWDYQTDSVGGAFYTRNGSPIIGGYSESGQRPSSVAGMVLGGMMGAPFNYTAGGGAEGSDQEGTGPVIEKDYSSGFRTLSNRNGGFLATDPDSVISTSTVTTRLGGAGSDILYSQNSPAYSGGWRLKWVSGGEGDLGLYWGNADASRVMRVRGPLTTHTAGRSSPVPYAVNFKMLLIGDEGNSARRLTTGGAAPTTGDWARGDVVFNAAPSAGGKVGWVCTSGGTPGTWKAFGAIDP